MLLEGKFNLKANIQKTWDNLIKPETLAACIPAARKWKRKTTKLSKT